METKTTSYVTQEHFDRTFLAPMTPFSCCQPPERQCVSHCGQPYCVKSSVSRETVTITKTEYDELKEYKAMYLGLCK